MSLAAKDFGERKHHSLLVTVWDTGWRCRPNIIHPNSRLPGTCRKQKLHTSWQNQARVSDETQHTHIDSEWRCPSKHQKKLLPSNAALGHTSCEGSMAKLSTTTLSITPFFTGSQQQLQTASDQGHDQENNPYTAKYARHPAHLLKGMNCTVRPPFAVQRTAPSLTRGIFPNRTARCGSEGCYFDNRD